MGWNTLTEFEKEMEFELGYADSLTYEEIEEILDLYQSAPKKFYLRYCLHQQTKGIINQACLPVVASSHGRKNSSTSRMTSRTGNISSFHSSMVSVTFR